MILCKYILSGRKEICIPLYQWLKPLFKRCLDFLSHTLLQNPPYCSSTIKKLNKIIEAVWTFLQIHVSDYHVYFASTWHVDPPRAFSIVMVGLGIIRGADTACRWCQVSAASWRRDNTMLRGHLNWKNP